MRRSLPSLGAAGARDKRAVRLTSAGGSRWWSSASGSTSTGTLRAQKDYIGSALRDGLSAVVLPRVGEHVLGLGPNAWRKGPYGEPYSVVHAVDHSATPAWKLDPTKPAEEEDPAVTLVFQALWPGDGPLAGPRMLREYDAQGGWQLHFFSNHAPVEPFPGHPLMGGLDLEGKRRP